MAKKFYNTDAEIHKDGEFEPSYVVFGNKKVDYFDIENFLFDKMEEEGIPISSITTMDFSYANQELLYEFISEQGTLI